MLYPDVTHGMVPETGGGFAHSNPSRFVLVALPRGLERLVRHEINCAKPGIGPRAF